MTEIEIRHFHLFCGLGGGARGFNRGEARVGNLRAKFRCLGGVDVDPAGIADFGRLAGVRGTVLDMFSREQYRAFHSVEPPPGWREATPADIHRACGNERPHIVFLSAPCKGFSGLLSETRSRTDKYQALNGLTLRGVWLMLEAFADDPPELIVFENVPRIAVRGRTLLDQIGALLRQYGYAVAETTHDCGELGGLAQSRKRFLLVARHTQKVQPFLYEPQMKPLRAVGDVLSRFPLPGDAGAGPMHRIPALAWKTWVRLAFVEAGSDWRSLRRLAVVDGALRDYLIVPDSFNGFLGVRAWDSHTGVVTSEARPSNGSFSVADPRFPGGGEYGQLGVRRWEQSTGTVTSQRSPIQGGFSVADPRMPDSATRQNGIYRVIKWEGPSLACTGATHVAGAAMSVADPRRPDHERWTGGKYRVTGFNESAGTVIASSTTGNGAFAVADPRPHDGPLFSKYPVAEWCGSSRTVIGGDDCGAYAVADPRPGLDRARGDDYLTAGHYGVVPWTSHAYSVTGHGRHDNGHHNVADPRLPAADERMIAVIRAEDGTWHRPFTTLELAALQGLVYPDEHMELEGLSDSAWRERIGNAVPPPAAQAIAGVMGRTLLLAWSGETFVLDAQPIWVRPIAVALMAAR